MCHSSYKSKLKMGFKQVIINYCLEAYDLPQNGSVLHKEECIRD